jgi:hypothetical protein
MYKVGAPGHVKPCELTQSLVRNGEVTSCRSSRAAAVIMKKDHQFVYLITVPLLGLSLKAKELTQK